MHMLEDVHKVNEFSNTDTLVSAIRLIQK